MKQELFDNEFNKMFKWFTNESLPSLLNLKIDFYKKLWNFFLIGDSFYFILNHNTLEIDFVSKEIKDVMGYTPSEFNLQHMRDNLHPDEHPFFLSIGVTLRDFFAQLPLDKLMKYKVRYDVRYKKKDGNYARILYQGLMLEHDEKGRILRTLGVHTDISYMKLERKPMLSLVGLDGEPSYIDVADKNIFIKATDELTRREKQILKLLVEGKSSKEIGSILNISKQTVDTHRKNMLYKNNLKNTGELIAKAICEGWI